MRHLLLLTSVLLSFTSFSQTEHSVSERKDHKKEIFVSTNASVFKPSLGLKIGFLSKPGIYVGFRHGASDLNSFIGGFNLPAITKDDLKLIAQLGAGYNTGEKSRYELEAGFMIQKQNLLFNITGNLMGIDGSVSGDLCLGIGFTLND